MVAGPIWVTLNGKVVIGTGLLVFKRLAIFRRKKPSDNGGARLALSTAIKPFQQGTQH